MFKVMKTILKVCSTGVSVCLFAVANNNEGYQTVMVQNSQPSSYNFKYLFDEQENKRVCASLSDCSDSKASDQLKEYFDLFQTHKYVNTDNQINELILKAYDEKATNQDIANEKVSVNEHATATVDEQVVTSMPKANDIILREIHSAAGSPPPPPTKLPEISSLNNMSVIPSAQDNFEFVYSISPVCAHFVPAYCCLSSLPGGGNVPGNGIGENSVDFHKTCDIITLQILIGLGVVMMIAYVTMWILSRKRNLTLSQNIVRGKRLGRAF